jgi:hypothetical protein
MQGDLRTTGKSAKLASPNKRTNGMRGFALGFVVLLAACSPQEAADKVARRAAETVVTPVVNVNMPLGLAQVATDCILNAATREEINLLARDVGVEAGTSTKATIRTIALRPGAQACYASAGVPPIQP